MNLIEPNWHAPANVHAFMTTRMGGVSIGAYGDVRGQSGLNPASHVSDDVTHVQQNRSILRALLPNDPLWLNQTHSIKVWLQTDNEYDHSAPPPEADAVVLTQKGAVGVIMTADCLPVLFASDDGQIIAAAHVGWRGLLDGVLERTVQVMAEQGADVASMHVWLGAAIGPNRFEVGQDVLDAFIQKTPQAAGDVQACFKRTDADKYLADIYGLARARLHALGITRITGGELCTVSDAERFYSYRRDHVTGRMASLIWFD